MGVKSSIFYSEKQNNKNKKVSQHKERSERLGKESTGNVQSKRERIPKKQRKKHTCQKMRRLGHYRKVSGGLAIRSHARICIALPEQQI